MQAILVLHDVRSAHNVGSLFRTADAAGIQKIYLSSTTPTPIDRFGRSRSDIAKTALGAEKSVSWEQYSAIEKVFEQYKSRGYTIIAIEQAQGSVDYKMIKVVLPIVFVLGNEVSGIPDDILKQVDVIAEIGMLGKKESLNVSVAGGIALFRMLNI